MIGDKSYTFRYNSAPLLSSLSFCTFDDLNFNGNSFILSLYDNAVVSRLKWHKLWVLKQDQAACIALWNKENLLTKLVLIEVREIRSNFHVSTVKVNTGYKFGNNNDSKSAHINYIQYFPNHVSYPKIIDWLVINTISKRFD